MTQTLSGGLDLRPGAGQPLRVTHLLSELTGSLQATTFLGDEFDLFLVWGQQFVVHPSSVPGDKRAHSDGPESTGRP